ncbi:MAG: NUDIX domain-containing protein [Planctomycetes bacterium]|nr:NUDIX domain-containing protein [Planctomycetota bacterium]
MGSAGSVAPTAIAVAVVTDGEMVLVGRRGDDAREAPGCAEFPGGKQESGEDPAEAAARECLEETGIEVAVGAEIARVRAAGRDGAIEITFLEATPVDRGAAPRAPFRWVNRAELAGLRFPAANGAIVARLIAAGHGGSSPPGCQG